MVDPGVLEKAGLPAESGLDAIGQGEPLLFGARIQFAEAADDFVPRPGGRADRFHQEVRDIRFIASLDGVLFDEHGVTSMHQIIFVSMVFTIFVVTKLPLFETLD
jgi:hypothetical protein